MQIAKPKIRPRIHSKVKTVGCVSPRTCKYSSEHAKIKTLCTHFRSKQNWKMQINNIWKWFPKCNFSDNPGRNVLGHLPFFTWFCMEFAANLQYTLINTALTRFFPTPLNKVEVLRCLTCSNQHCSGGRGINFNYISSPKTRSVPNFWIRIVAFHNP